MDNIEDLLRKRKKLLEEIDKEINAGYSKPVSLLFTDIVGSTKYFENKGDIAGRQMIQTHNDLLFPIIKSYEGRIIKTIGDSIMASFEDPLNSVECAIKMQEALKKYNTEKHEKDTIKVRMGLHYGRAMMDEKDLFGDMVNTSARVESRAAGEEILISAHLKEQIEEPGIPFVYLGSDYVKGKKEKIDFFLINWNKRYEEEIIESWNKRASVASKPDKVSALDALKVPHVKKQKVVIKEKLNLSKAAKELKPLSKGGNPYLNRVMIPHPDLFFGRKGTVKRIMRRISSERPQSVSIVGERRIGKSSLLNFLNSPPTRLNYLENAEHYFFLFIDFQQLRSIDIQQFFEIIFSELEKQSGDIIELSITHDYEGMRFLSEQLTSEGYKLILLFDEFESVTKNEKIGPEFYAIFRSLANNFSIAFITSSGKNLKNMCVSHEIADSPFFNIFTVQHLGLFHENEAMSLITEPSESRGMPLKPVAEKILSIGGFYPFFLQMACASWFEFLEVEELDAVDFKDKKIPKDVLNFFREESEPHFEYILETLQPEEIEVFKQIVKGISPDSPHVQILERKGYIIEAPEGGFKPFSSEFLIFLKRALD